MYKCNIHSQHGWGDKNVIWSDKARAHIVTNGIKYSMDVTRLLL